MVVLATGSFIVQKETLPPKEVPGGDTSSSCVFFIVGEWLIKPDRSKTISCVRHTAITPQEATGLGQRTLYAFFIATFMYRDPIGVTRTLTQIFLLRPEGKTGKFVQVGSREEASTNRTPDQDADIERVLVDTILQIEQKRSSSFPSP
jgi:hypothetical protein